MGLDRSPEVKNPTKKLKIIAVGTSKEWGADLYQMWMDMYEYSCYVDVYIMHIQHLCSLANETETMFPGTKLCLFYELVLV